MGRGRLVRSTQKWCSLVTALALLGLASKGSATNDGPSPSFGQAGSHSDSETNNNKCSSYGQEKKFLLLVSTMDGKVSALDLDNKGTLQWSIEAGETPLISSSISKLELTRNGVPTRLVPSLDGSVYQLNEESIEALPFNADTLLSSSFKLNEDFTIVGGKETLTYGIETRTGKVRYVCSMDGCTKFDNGNTLDTEDVIVITRHSKTVRAIEMRTGHEKWNFSVGQHEVSFIPTIREQHYLAEAVKTSGDMDEDVSVSSCPLGEENVIEDDWYDYWFSEETTQHVDLDLKVIVPKGLVIAVRKSNPQEVLWEYQFEVPIANAWTLQNDELSELGLFDGRFIPALGVHPGEDDGEPRYFPTPAEPLLYIGSHEQQIYVQPSVRLVEELHGSMEALAAQDTSVAMPRVRWRPYIATAPSRTPLLPAHYRHQVAWEHDESPEEDHRLTVWQDQYPFDSGMYVMADTSPVSISDLKQGASNSSDVYNDITVSLWNWWREVLAISVMTSIIVHFVLVKFFRPHITQENSVTQGSTESSNTKTQTVGSDSLTAETGDGHHSDKPAEYISRFASEFDRRACLGRGGFGVVFEAANKMDDCAYAIKRITLNNSERAREKVMREVKALAKLDHVGIVRYYQAWFENPPAGWQETQDKLDEYMLSGTPTPVYSATTDLLQADRHGLKGSDLSDIHEVTHLKTKDNETDLEVNSSQSFSHSLGFNEDHDNPLKVFGGLSHWSAQTQSDWSISETSKKAGGSGGFVPRADVSMGGLDESGSYSIGFGTPGRTSLLDDNFSIEFQNTNSKDNVSESQSHSGCMPFDGYSLDKHNNNSKGLDETNESFNIVFEDSGCAEKSSNDDAFIEDSLSFDVVPKSMSCLSKTRSRSLPIEKTSQSKDSQSARSSTAPPRPMSLELCSQQRDKSPKQNHGEDSKGHIDPLAPKLYLYIQMQLCKIESLKDWLNANTLQRDRREMLDIFDQIVSAVGYIHDSSLMHRDLKPSNIFFSMDGTVKVGDFGLVTTLEECHGSAAHTPLHTAQHTGQVGTKLYMSPEQANGRSYSHKVDIYSLGLIFFELFYPFATEMERIKILLDVRNSKYPERFARELPDECNFVRSMLHINPDLRPSTFDIQQNPLLQDFEAARQTICRIRPRTRTVSSSESSNSLSSSI